MKGSLSPYMSENTVLAYNLIICLEIREINYNEPIFFSLNLENELLGYLRLVYTFYIYTVSAWITRAFTFCNCET